MTKKPQKNLFKNFSPTKLFSVLFFLIIIISFIFGYLFNQEKLLKKVQDFRLNPKPSNHISTTNPPIKSYRLGKSLHWTTFTDLNYGLVFNYPNYLTEVIYNFPKTASEGGSVDDYISISNRDGSSSLQIYLNPRFGGVCSPAYFYDAIQTNGNFNLTYTKEKPEPSSHPGCEEIFYSAMINLENGDKLLMTFTDGNRHNEEDFESILGSFWVKY